MPKKKMLHKIVAYDKQGNFFGSCPIWHYTYDEAFAEYLDYCKLLIESQFHNISRLDLVGGNHVLFVFSDVRSLLNQYLQKIKIQNYD